MSLLDVHPSQTGRISVVYSDAPPDACKIESLHQTDLVIYNIGSKDIVEPVELELIFRRKGDSRVSQSNRAIGLWRLVFDDPTCKSTGVPTDESEADQSVTITVPYLNSYSTHRHSARAYLITEHAVELQLVRGMGRGWSASLYTIERYRNASLLAARTIRVVAMSVFIMSSLWLVIEMMRDPVYSALYNPTLGNLDRLIDLLSRQREIVQVQGVAPIWVRFLSGLRTEIRTSAVLSFWAIQAVAWFYLSLNLTRLAGWITAKYLHIVPPNRWLKADGTSPSSRTTAKPNGGRESAYPAPSPDD